MTALNKRDDDLEELEYGLFGFAMAACAVFLFVVIITLVKKCFSRKPDSPSDKDTTPKGEIKLDSSESRSSILQVPTRVYTSSVNSGCSSSESVNTLSANFQKLPDLEAVGVQKYTCCEWCAIPSNSDSPDYPGMRPS